MSERKRKAPSTEKKKKRVRIFEEEDDLVQATVERVETDKAIQYPDDSLSQMVKDLVEDTRNVVDCRGDPNLTKADKAIPHMVPDDGLARMVRMSTLFQSPAFEEKPSNGEQVLKDLQLSDDETPAAPPSPRKPMLPPSEVDYMICPCHFKRLEDRTSAKGWEYMRCPDQPCFLFCGKDQVQEYMSEVYKNIHPDICDNWRKINCFCGNYPTLKQGHSAKNPGRLYLCCSVKGCKFFRWTDQPIPDFDPKDPLSMQLWLKTQTPPPRGLGSNVLDKPAPPPPKYCDSFENFEEMERQVRYGKGEMVEIDPPVPLKRQDAVYYGKENLRKQYTELGLF